jgi:2-polyprenyl-3-methyl-5-hydroxy-6-metoxy-1,4-benzoquinol methylase
MDNWRNVVYSFYLSSRSGQFTKIDEKDYESATLGYARIWDGVLPASVSTRCLDIGCGPGKFLYYLGKRGFSNIRGVDLSPENVEIARKRGLDVECADALSFLKETIDEGHTFGLISLQDVIEHFSKEDLVKLLTGVAEALEPNGILLIKTGNASSLLATSGRYIDFTHELMFTEESLRQVLLTTGFKEPEIILPSNRGFKNCIRRILKTILYWLIYRIIENRKVPRCIDFDILMIARK